jgi:3-methyladenine DNA glycosylase AlkC
MAVSIKIMIITEAVQMEAELNDSKTAALIWEALPMTRSGWKQLGDDNMAKKFKDYYDIECAALLADKIKAVWPEFKEEAFITMLKDELEDKEFLQLQDAFVKAFEVYLPNDYQETVSIFRQILGPELETTKGMFATGWWLWPVGRFIEYHGIKDFQISITFIYELTKRFTGEFAIRPIIDKWPVEAITVIKGWSKDNNVHVRRLASEGLRIRLPWAKKSLVVLDYFDDYKVVLSNLKSDPEKFVQKSVGNNINDLVKECPDKAKEIITAWQEDNPTKETLWIIKHGLRSGMLDL